MKSVPRIPLQDMGTEAFSIVNPSFSSLETDPFLGIKPWIFFSDLYSYYFIWCIHIYIYTYLNMTIYDFYMDISG